MSSGPFADNRGSPAAARDRIGGEGERRQRPRYAAGKPRGRHPGENRAQGGGDQNGRRRGGRRRTREARGQPAIAGWKRLGDLEGRTVIVERGAALLGQPHARRVQILKALAGKKVRRHSAFLRAHIGRGKGRLLGDGIVEKRSAKCRQSRVLLRRRDRDDVTEHGCDAVDRGGHASGLQFAFARDFQDRHYRKIGKDHRRRNHRDELGPERRKGPHQRISTSDVNI